MVGAKKKTKYRSRCSFFSHHAIVRCLIFVIIPLNKNIRLHRILHRLGFAGFEFGTGLVVARRTDPESGPDDWSAPSAIGVAGFAWGALLGAQVSDHIFLLMTEDAVRLFASEGGRSIQLGADVGVALGPLGRSAEADLGATAGPSRGLEHDGFSGVAMAPIFTYSLSKGLYAGVSLDGRMLMTRDRVNEKFYGGAVSAHELLSGRVPNPPAAQPLYDALKRCRVYGGGEGGEGSDGEGYIYGSRNFGEEGYDPLEQLSHTTGMGIPATSLSAESRHFSPRNLYNLNARENFTPGFD
jgi:lipid-binding SYLF domain-containing protein